MTVFKSVWKIVNKYKFVILFYTILLIGFGGLTLETSEQNLNFVGTKANIAIVNYDEHEGITKDFVEYLEMHANVMDIEEKDLNDALFYRSVSYIVYIPQNFRSDFLSGKDPQIEVKSTGDYQASLTEMLVFKYMKTASIYLENGMQEIEILQNTHDTLESQVQVELTSQLNTNALSRASLYYNFLNYSVLAGCVYVICLILASFKNEKIKKRITVSSMEYQKFNWHLLMSNGLLAFILWVIYVLISIFLLGNIMFTIHGFLYMLNSLIFTLCAVTVAFLIGNVIQNKNAINGIINVVALGSSFLCGAFVPAEFLPSSVLKIAHILPSFWFISNNDYIKQIDQINFVNLIPYFINLGVLLLFAILFIIVMNCITRKHQRN